MSRRVGTAMASHVLRGLGALAVVLAVAGCTGSTAGPEAGSTSSVTFGSPPPESTQLEGPEGDADQIALELPGLPVGGSATVGTAPTCVPVNWSGSEIPEGVGVRPAGLSVTPSEAFAPSSTPCDAAPPCVGGSFAFSTTDPSCTVSVVSTVGEPTTGELQFSAGTLICGPDLLDVCTQFRDEVAAGGPETVSLTAANEPDGAGPEAGTEGGGPPGEEPTGDGGPAPAGEGAADDPGG